MAKNEATLGARIDSVLTSVFPTFKTVKVQHQKSFSIKFGHHNVAVDLKEPSKYPARGCISIVNKIIINEKNNDKSYEDLCKLLIDSIAPIPYCDIAANGVLMEMAKANEIDLFSNLVQELLKRPPQLEKIKKGTKILMYSEGVGHIQMNFEDDIDEDGFVSDFLPYAILSQLAAYPLSIIGNEEYSQYAFHLYLLNEVGSNKHLLRRADVRSLNNMKTLEGVDWEGVGYIVSGHEGIIEPFVQSIQKCFIQIPEEIKHLYERAFNENNFNLLYRIYLALRTMVNFTNPEIANQAKGYVIRFNKYFNVFMADILSKDVQDPIEREAMRKILLELKINEDEETE